MEILTSSESSELKEFLNKYAQLLNEIRKRILFTICIFIAAMVVGFVFYEQIIKFLLDILSLKGINIVFTSPFQFINLAISCGIASGVILVFPLLTYQILSFLKPALRKHEYTMIIRFLPFSILLFLSGFSFGFLIMKWQIEIFLAKSISLGIGNLLDISHLLSTVILTSVFIGISFQFPIVLLLLTRLGILKHHQLAKQRPWVYLGSLIFAILLPPDSVLADFLLALPLAILFEVSLILNRFLGRKRETAI